MWPVAPNIYHHSRQLLSRDRLLSVRIGEGLRTIHTSGLGGFCGPGGFVVEGRWSFGSREADEGDDDGYVDFEGDV